MGEAGDAFACPYNASLDEWGERGNAVGVVVVVVGDQQVGKYQSVLRDIMLNGLGLCWVNDPCMGGVADEPNVVVGTCW